MILKELSEAIGVSGDEGEVRTIIKKAITGHVDQMWVDNLGNLLAIKKGTGKIKMRVLLDAHMDEVGLMVTGYDKDGSLQFNKVGGIDDRILLGKAYWVGPDKIPGVIGGKPVHLLDRQEYAKVVSSDNLRIDIGAANKDEAANKVKIGDRATFATRFVDTGPTMMGKAFDDRAGCAVLVKLLQSDPYPMDIMAAFTVQEEVGLRGAKVVGYRLEPDMAFTLEGTICDDMPKDEDEDISPVTEVGKGPAISIMDKRTIADPRLVKFLAATAEKHAIPFQFRRTTRGGTDAGAIHTSRTGIPSVGVSLPSRHIHSTTAVCSKDDLDNTIRLVKAALYELSPDVISRN
ncbi:MAG: M42 family metallopeptidase [Anaerolineales bacterium]|nr:M42 family metallopeptidase [Anaerolineales bacterium]